MSKTKVKTAYERKIDTPSPYAFDLNQPLKLRPGQEAPLVPHVLVVCDRLHPYKLPEIERATVLYSTATMVRVLGAAGYSKSKHKVYCLPTETAWTELQTAYSKLQTALDALANYLRSLLSYIKKLEAAGGIKTAPNPLSPTVICAPDPDYNHTPIWNDWDIYPPTPIQDQVEKHTPQMLKLIGNPLQEYTTQGDRFCCPSKNHWFKYCKLHGSAQSAAHTLKTILKQLGTYDQASDGRYTSLPPERELPPEPVYSFGTDEFPSLPPESQPQSNSLIPGNQVEFKQYWNGDRHTFIGTITEIRGNTAIVNYAIPPHLDDGVKRVNQIQAPIGIFALQKVLPEPNELPPENAEAQINQIKQQGPVAPTGVWIECCKVPHSNFRQAYWRSRDPCFTPKRGSNPEAKCRKQYIGAAGSEAHKKAIAEVERRNQIQLLTKKLNSHYAHTN